MKVAVLKKFVDRNSKELREKGKMYDYADESRVKELEDGGYIKRVSDKEIKAETKK